MIQSDDPRVLAWQAANNLLGESAQFEPGSADHVSRVSLAQVYATLASVSSDVLTGIQLAQLAHHMQAKDLQERVEQQVSEELSPEEQVTEHNGVNVTGNDDNVIPLR